MQMGMVQMGADRCLVMVSQTPSGKFAADVMRLLRRHFAGLETLDQVVGQYMAFAVLPPPFPGCGHGSIGIGRA